MPIRKWVIYFITAFCFICNNVLSQPVNSVKKLLYPALVEQFYTLNNQQVFWFTSSASSAEIRDRFLQVIDSAKYFGLDREKYHYSEMRDGIVPKDAAELMTLDKLFTDMVIAFCKDVYQGGDIQKWIRNDEVSVKYAVSDDDYLLDKIVYIRSVTELDSMLARIEPVEKEYAILKEELKKQITAGDKRKTEELVSTVNLYRWIYHFRFDKFIVVNIPSATLRYYEQGVMKLQMSVVVGKPSTRSPRFSTWCNEVILYPYWNVPRSIAVKELLPRFKKNPASIETMDMQVIGSNDQVIDYRSINWSKYNRNNFPYSFRQCTGCDNSLGVIKFNLTDPFSVYMHDTNYKLAFLSKTRYFSHGCIRVEKPIELGNYLLNSLDSSYLKACLKDQNPVTITLKQRVPVFVVYIPAEAPADTVKFYKDIYKLF